MPITVQHRPAGSARALAQAAYRTGAQDWWAGLARSGLSAARIYEGRRRQERDIGAREAYQERAAGIRGEERAEVRGFAEQGEEDLAQGAFRETGIAKAPGESNAAYLARVRGELGVERQSRTAKGFAAKRREKAETDLNALYGFRDRLAPGEFNSRERELQRIINGIPAEERKTPAQAFEQETFTQPATGKTFTKNKDGSWKKIDEPEPEKDAGPLGDRATISKGLSDARKELEAEAKAAVALSGKPQKAVPTEAVIEKYMEKVAAIRRIQEGLDPAQDRRDFQQFVEQGELELPAGPGAPPPIGAPEGLAPPEAPLAPGAPQAAPAPGVAPVPGAPAGVPPAGDLSSDVMGTFFPFRPGNVKTEGDFIAWVQSEKPRLERQIAGGREYQTLLQKFQGKGFSDQEAELAVMNIILQGERLDELSKRVGESPEARREYEEAQKAFLAARER